MRLIAVWAALTVGVGVVAAPYVRLLSSPWLQGGGTPMKVMRRPNRKPSTEERASENLIASAPGRAWLCFYGIAFGLDFDVPREVRARLTRWMRIWGIGELKRAPVDVMLGCLAVDFLTDATESQSNAWQIPVLPLCIFSCPPRCA